MKNTIFAILCAFACSALVGAHPIVALHQQESAKQEAPKDWKFSGYADGFYSYSWNRPPRRTALFGRQFDLKQGEARLAAAQLNVEYKSAKTPWSFFGSVWAGDNAETLYLTEPGKGFIAKHIPQAILSFRIPGKKNHSIDFGKFYSWVGYEGAESASNDNYSRGLLYTLCEPAYHTGFRFNFELNDRTSASLYLVQGWNELKDGNNDRSYGAALRHTTKDGTSLVGNFYFGREGSNTANRAGSFGGVAFGAAGRSDVSLVNVNAMKQLNPRWKVGLNIDYANASGNAARGRWYGIGGYATYSVCSKSSLAGRIETVRDTNGLRTGLSSTVSAATLTYNYAFNSHWSARFELRHDWSNRAFFPSDTVAKRQQTNFALVAHVKF